MKIEANIPSLTGIEVDKMIETITLQISIIFVSHFLSSAIDGNGEILNLDILKKMIYVTIALIIHFIFVYKHFKPKN
jgi:two-component SAPR family response regulator